MVTPAQLRKLAKLHREGVEGAGQRLVDMAAHDPHAFAEIIGSSGQWMRAVLSGDEPARSLVVAVEHGALAERAHRKQEARHKAKTLADELHQYCRRFGTSVMVEPKALLTLASTAGYRALAFNPSGDPEVVKRQVLRRVLSACKRAELAPIEVAPGCIRLVYRTDRSRGCIQLRSRPVVGGDRDELLVVPLDRCQEPRTPPKPTKPEPAQPSPTAEPLPAPRRNGESMTPLRAVLGQVLDALAETGL